MIFVHVNRQQHVLDQFKTNHLNGEGLDLIIINTATLYNTANTHIAKYITMKRLTTQDIENGISIYLVIDNSYAYQVVMITIL